MISTTARRLGFGAEAMISARTAIGVCNSRAVCDGAAMLWTMARRAAGVVADALFPPRCPLCDAFEPTHGTPCVDCAASLQALEPDAHLPDFIPHPIARCRSRFAYEGKVREVLHGFKYGDRLDLLRFLSRELAAEARQVEGIDLIVPVSLHPKRLRQRGFNQAALLARSVGKILGLPVALDALLRTRDIPPQVGLEREERVHNTKGAFAVRERCAPRIAGKSILLIDDVLTTGATLGECARVLKKAGAVSVAALTVARTL